jgi:hypothetical protein
MTNIFSEYLCQLKSLGARRFLLWIYTATTSKHNASTVAFVFGVCVSNKSQDIHIQVGHSSEKTLLSALFFIKNTPKSI